MHITQLKEDQLVGNLYQSRLLDEKEELSFQVEDVSEINKKLKGLKTQEIKIEELSIFDRIRNCTTLIDIFGAEFCEELAELHEDEHE